MKLGSSGGYFSLQDFIRRLYELDRAVRIDNLTMAGTQTETAGVEITLDLTARIFFELPGAPGSTTEAPPNTTTAPATGETPAPATTP